MKKLSLICCLFLLIGCGSEEEFLESKAMTSMPIEEPMKEEMKEEMEDAPTAPWTSSFKETQGKRCVFGVNDSGERLDDSDDKRWLWVEGDASYTRSMSHPYDQVTIDISNMHAEITYHLESKVSGTGDCAFAPGIHRITSCNDDTGHNSLGSDGDLDREDFSPPVDGCYSFHLHDRSHYPGCHPYEFTFENVEWDGWIPCPAEEDSQ